MHIVHLIDNLKRGGAQKLLLTFAQVAQARGWPVTVISLQSAPDTPWPAQLMAAGAQVVYCAGHSLLDPVRLWRLHQLLTGGHFAVVHTHLTYANILGGLLAPLAGLPCVTSLHNTVIDVRHAHPVRNRLEAWLLQHRTRRVLAVGHAVATSQQPRLGHKKIETIVNAVAPVPPLPLADRTALRAALVGDAQRPILLGVGRLAPQKGFADLLTAFAAVRAQHPTAALLIAGTGQEEAALKAQVAEAQLTGQAFLLGPRDDVPRLLAASDIFVSASHWEGLPVAILEAMAAGLPIVATSVGDVPQVVTPETGLIVAPHQPAALTAALHTLLTDPARRAALGTAAHARAAQEYSAEVWFEKLARIYQEVVNSGKESGVSP